MNIVTKSDIKQFLTFMKAGIEHGTGKELKTYTSTERYLGTDVPKSHYISLELRFNLSPEIVDQIIENDSVDNEIKEMLQNINS